MKKERVAYVPTGVRIDYGESTYVGTWKIVKYKHKNSFNEDIDLRNVLLTMPIVTIPDGQDLISDEWGDSSTDPRKHGEDLW